MRDDTKRARMAEIEAVAYDLLATQGYDATSMLAVAKAAKASNGTLYRWYGDKNGLFASMVRANAALVKEALEKLIAEGGTPLEVLSRIAPVLLGMLLSERAIALNRAAAADTSGTLGQALLTGGRADVLPLIAAQMQAAVEAGELGPPATGTMPTLFMHLLVGDRQIRRVIGTLPAPSEQEISQQASDAIAQFCSLCPPA